IDNVERQITKLEIERAALKKEHDLASKERLHILERELADFKEQSAQMKARWQNEVKVIKALQSQKEELEQKRQAQVDAERGGDLNRAAELKFGEIPGLEKRIEATRMELEQQQKDGAMLREEVTPEEIAEVVSAWTHIPVAKMLEAEMAKLVKMESRLRERV